MSLLNLKKVEGILRKKIVPQSTSSSDDLEAPMRKKTVTQKERMERDRIIAAFKKEALI